MTINIAMFIKGVLFFTVLQYATASTRNFFTVMQYAAPRNHACGFSRALRPNARYEISSPTVSGPYQGFIDCHWDVTCPEGYNCLLDCPDVKIPVSQDCSTDALVIQGSPDTVPYRHCGYEPITDWSLENQLSITLRTHYSPRGSSGGKFFCQVTCVNDSKELVDFTGISVK